jgi:hypothetical protein
MNYIKNVSAGVLEYDTRIFLYDWNPIKFTINDLINNSTKKDLIHQ